MELKREVLLKKMFDIGNFQQLQDKLANASEVAILTVDFNGQPVSAHSSCSEFCKIIRTQSYYSEFCKRCDSRGGLEASINKKPFIYMCHMGLVDFAIPVRVGENYVGAVMAGQIRLSDQAPLERVTDKHNEIYLDNEMLTLYNKLPMMDYERIKSLSDMLFSLYNYVTAEAASKLFPGTTGVNMIGDAPTLLAPAIKYIYDNFTKAIRLDAMAILCGISPTYFSKLFKKHYKIGLSEYVTKMRIDTAKQLLITTKKSVVDIGYEVGYEDCGYFIKTFKKETEFTPKKFRENFSKSSDFQ